MIRILLLALLLSSCGGDDESSSGSSSGGFFSIFAIDPYIVDAVFFYDADEDGIYDEGELLSTPTDINGYASFSSVIPAGGKIIQLTGGIMDGFNYNGKLKGISNGTGGVILSPLTTLSANEFSNQQILNLLSSAGITITEDQITENPMEDPNLLRAALSVSQGLLASLKGFDLFPSDVVFSGTKATIDDSYADQLFKHASQVYGQVITNDEFNSNLVNLSKVTSSFQDYMQLYGASDFSSPTAIEEAKSALDSAVIDSTNSFEPVSLTKNVNGFSAKVVYNDWFDYQEYDLLGIDFFNNYTRIVDNTIGNYPFSPWKVEIKLASASINQNGMQVLSTSPSQASWTLDPESNMIYFQGSLEQGDGAQPINAQTVGGLPISTYNRVATANLRGMGLTSTGTINEKNMRLVGDGNAIYTYYGIDWGTATPTDTNQWTVNKSRTNNCLINNQPTTDCDEPLVTKSYKSLKENAYYKSFSALTSASDRGSPLSPNAQMKFSIRNQPLGATTTSAPVEYTLSQLELLEADLRLVDFDNLTCLNPKGCLAVKALGDPFNNRPPLNDSKDVSFFVGYENFPTDYKVYAINKIVVTKGNSEPQVCNTFLTSSFFKANIIVLHLNCSAQDQFPDLEYLFLDLSSRRGLAGSYLKSWKEDVDGNNVEKFLYRDFRSVILKEVIP